MERVNKAADVHKTALKYQGLDRMYIFQPLAVESLGPFDDEGCCFLADLGRKISAVSGDDRDGTFLFQRISVSNQRHNSILLRQSVCDDTRPDGHL